MKFRWTPIFLTSLVVLVISIPLALYYLTIGSSGGMALAGFIALIFAVVSFGAINLEHFLLENYKPRSILVWALELTLIFILVVNYLYSQKEITYTIDDKKNWFATVFVKENYDKAEHTLPFNINYKIMDRQVLFINLSEQQGYNRTYVSWGGYRTDGSDSINVGGKNYSYCIFQKYNVKLNKEDLIKVRSVIKVEIQKLPILNN